MELACAVCMCVCVCVCVRERERERERENSTGQQGPPRGLPRSFEDEVDGGGVKAMLVRLQFYKKVSTCGCITKN